MDDTMSSYSFSHQFYQRWTCAPEPIRAAITQELKDITTLLQADTPFESFVFNTHDLDTHVDELYENHEAEQAIANAIADKQAQEQAATEKRRLEEEEKKQAAEDAKRKEETKAKEEARLHEQAEATKKQQEENYPESATAIDTNATEKVSDNSSVINSVEKKVSTNIATAHTTISEYANTIDDGSTDDNRNTADKRAKSDSSIKAINDKASAAISLALKDTKLNSTHQELIRELEMQIDDYLSDQMMLMSENLKSWLRAEMAQHLTEEDNAVTDDSVAKK